MDKINSKEKRTFNSKTMVFTALIFALSILLAYFEQALPPLPIPVPGVKLGISNIMVMFALFFIGKKEAFYIAILKSAFVFSMRGFMSSVLSLSGGISSVVIMTVLMFIFKDKISYTMLSISGAVFHNIGQIIAASIFYTPLLIVVYLPILIITGTLTGFATATLLKFILPAIKKVGIKIK